MPHKINIGIIGSAAIADKYILPNLLALKKLYSVVGIASRDISKAKEFSKKFNIQTFHGYDSLLNEKELDALYIPLPNSLHAEWVEKALNKNLHVLVEKSLACSLKEVKYLNLLASERQLILIENFQFRFHKQIEMIRNFVSEGKIGELRCLRSSFGFPPFQDPHNIRYSKKLGGGALLDAGAYPVKIAQVFLGNELTVKAANLNYSSTADVDIWGGAYLCQKDGNLFAEIAFGFDNYYQCNLELWGSKGKIYTNRIFTAPPDYSSEIVIESNSKKERIIVPADNHFQNMLSHFHKLTIVKQGMEDEYNQNIHQARIIEEIRNTANGK